MRVAYLVSRFPHVSETFIVRELDGGRRAGRRRRAALAVPAGGRHGPSDRAAVAHARCAAAAPGSALAGSAWWVRRRPLRLVGSPAAVAGGYARRPALLVRALVTTRSPPPMPAGWPSGGVDHVHAHYATYPRSRPGSAIGSPASATASRRMRTTCSSTARSCAGAPRTPGSSSRSPDFNRAVPARALRRADAGPVHTAASIRPRIASARARPRSGPVRALCVASLQEYKGHAVLLGRSRAEPTTRARLELDLVGGGPLRAELEQRGAALGLAARVRFHGSLPEPAVAQLLDRADCFVLPSVVAHDGQMEGIPVALMEALAAGVPVVATRLSGIPELVRDGETGLLAEPGDVADLRRALRALLADPAARADAARRRAAASSRPSSTCAPRRRALAGLFRDAAQPK